MMRPLASIHYTLTVDGNRIIGVGALLWVTMVRASIQSIERSNQRFTSGVVSNLSRGGSTQFSLRLH